MKKLTAQHRVIGGVFCLFFLGSITQAQDDGTIITTSEEPVVVIDSYEAALDENTKQSDLNIGEAVEPDFFNDIVDRIRGIFTSDDGSVEIGFLEGVFKSDTPALRIDQEGDAILQGDLTVRTVKSAGDLTVGSPEEVHNTEGKAITVGDKDRGVIELHGGDGQGVTAKGIVQTGEFGMELGTLTNQVLKFFTNSTPRMSITTEGNVGIGETTTNPTARLEVGGDIKATDTITATSFIGDGSQLTGIEGKFVDGTSATDAVFTTGNVGIGMTDPGAKLEVAGDTKVSGSITASSFIGDGSQLTGIEGKFVDGDTATDAVFTTGNVGIGTTEPNNELVVGESRMNDLAGGDPAIEVGGDRAFISLGKSNTERVQLGWNNENNGGNQYADLTTAGSSPQPLVLQRGGGNVGIGTTDPEVQLEIDSKGGAPNADYNVTIENAALSLASSQGGDVGIGTGTRLLGGVGSSEYAWLQAQNSVYNTAQDISLNPVGGNVGIGTTDPKVTFEIAGDTPYMRMKSKSNSETSIGFTNSSNWVVSGIGHDFYSGKLFFAQGGGASLSNTKMVIDSAGNVGIGTTDPLSYAGPNLDIQTGGLAINGQAITYYWPSSDTIGIGDVNSGDGLRDNLVLKTRDQDRLFINGSGNVGIGTTDPNYKLHVKGLVKHDMSMANAARGICYSAISTSNNRNKSIIMIPLPSYTSNLDAVCHQRINSGWHAGGVVKSNYFNQNCNHEIENNHYGGGYTSYVTEGTFESNRSTYTNCNSSNTIICCSPQFPN